MRGGMGLARWLADRYQIAALGWVAALMVYATPVARRAGYAGRR